MPRRKRLGGGGESPADLEAYPEIQKQVGTEIRQLRKARGLTLQQLAEKTGLSIGYLSEMERSLTAPSIKSLFDISRSLGVNIGWFFSSTDEGPEDERDMIVRSARRRRLSYDNQVKDYLLSPHLAGKLEMILSHFAPGASSGEISYAHEGEECGFVISGRFEIWIDDRYFLLEEGDSFSFPSIKPHRYRNPGESEAMVIWVITPPSF